MTYTEKESAGHKVTALCLALSIVVFAVDASIPLGVAGGVPYIAVVLISLRSPMKKLPYNFAVLGSALTVMGYYSSPPGGELWQVLFNRFLALFAIWVTAILGIQRKTTLEEKEKALSEVKVLSGLLPICASCKKIRDDAGYWNHIESYIRENSEANFSHGICPDCAAKLYPEITPSDRT